MVDFREMLQPWLKQTKSKTESLLWWFPYSHPNKHLLGSWLKLYETLSGLQILIQENLSQIFSCYRFLRSAHNLWQSFCSKANEIHLHQSYKNQECYHDRLIGFVLPFLLLCQCSNNIMLIISLKYSWQTLLQFDRFSSSVSLRSMF